MTYADSLRCEIVPHHATPSACDRCGSPLSGRQTRWCSRRCESEYRANHAWGEARKVARARDGGCVRPDCMTPHDRVEVNHIVPRHGRGYGWDCAHHLSGLETLCHDHHLAETRLQREARRAARVPS